MKRNKWFILIVSLGLVLIATGIGVTSTTMADLETSNTNNFQAWTSSIWTQTTQTDFEAGVLSQVDITSNSGNVTLDKQSDWYNASWIYRRQITIDHTQVSGTDQSDFPVLISQTDTAWKDTSNGGHMGQSDGGDIVFTSSDGITKLPHEIEKYTASTGELITWVQIPTLSASSDTVIYMYYGNASCANQWNINGTWDNNYEMVQHLKDDPDNAHTKDSTSHNHDGVKDSADNPIETTGKIDKAQDFSSDQISCGDLGIGDSYTAECWIKCDNLNGSGDYNTYGFTVMASSVWGQGYPLWLTVRGTEVRLWAYETTPSTGGWRETSGAGLNITDYFYIVATAIRGSTTKVYVNGVERLSFTNDGEVDWCNIFTVGDLRPGRAIYFDGIIDEVRISSTARDADWIITVYNNQNSPSTFCSVGTEVGVYYSSGTLDSKVLDTMKDSTRWDGLFWDVVLPAGTGVSLEVRASDIIFTKDTPPGTLPWNPAGGTSPITSGLPAGRYMQWRATLTTLDTSITPTLQEVRTYYFSP